MRTLRSWRTALVFAAALACTSPALAICFQDADCPAGEFGGIRECTKQKAFGITLFFGNCVRPGACNVDANCNTGGACINGTCMQPGGSSGGDTGRGKGIPGEGRHCMPADGSKPADWARDSSGKPLGACPSGTRCNANGICVRLET